MFYKFYNGFILGIVASIVFFCFYFNFTNNTAYQKEFDSLNDKIYDLSFSDEALLHDASIGATPKKISQDYLNVETSLYSYIKQVYSMGGMVSKPTFCLLYAYDKANSDLIDESNKPFLKEENITYFMDKNTMIKHMLLEFVNIDNQEQKIYSTNKLIKYDVASCKKNDTDIPSFYLR